MNDTKYKVSPRMSVRIRANQRIGPHPKAIIELMVGNLLGDGSLERRCGATRFVISQENTNQEYLAWLHTQYAEAGYCSPVKPRQQKRIGKGNIVRWTLRCRTWSYTSLNWLHEMFYHPGINRVNFVDRANPLDKTIVYRKRVSDELEYWLTPRAIAVWFMDDGSVSGDLSTGGLKFATNGFSLHDVEKLQAMFLRKYAIVAQIHRTKKHPDQGVLAFGQRASKQLAFLLSPWMHPSMKYKLRAVRVEAFS